MGAGHRRDRLRPLAGRRVLRHDAHHAVRRRRAGLEEPPGTARRGAHLVVHAAVARRPDVGRRRCAGRTHGAGDRHGTGCSTALACERLGSADVTSIEVDPHRLEQAADALYSCGYTPTLAVADDLYGYWPEAPFDRIVAACSFRAVPPALLGQARPGGKILLTLSGWLYGYARVLLTIGEDDIAEGQLLGGTVSFMSARTHAAPAFGNPAHWAAGLPQTGRAARHSPERITAASKEAFHLRFLAQCAVPDVQMTTVGEVVHLVDVVSGSAAALIPVEGWWDVRESGPVRVWERIERVLSAYDEAGRPGPETFTLHVHDGGQHLRHPHLPDLPLPRP